MSGEITGGIKVEAIRKFNAPLPKPEPGKHLWIMTAAWYVTTPPVANARVFLDMENLMSVDGPGCFWCGEVWTPDRAYKPCPGDVCR